MVKATHPKKVTSTTKAKEMLKPKPAKVPLVEITPAQAVNPATIPEEKKKKLMSVHLITFDRNRDLESAVSGKQDAYAKKLLKDVSHRHNKDNRLTKAESMNFTFQGATVFAFHDGIEEFQDRVAHSVVNGIRFSDAKTIDEDAMERALLTDVTGGDELMEGGRAALAEYNKLHEPKIRVRKAPKPITKARPPKKDQDPNKPAGRGRKPKAATSVATK